MKLGGEPGEIQHGAVGPIKKLIDLPGAELAVGGQCCGGAEYRNPTGWLSNSKGLPRALRTCPGPLEHLVHPALQGFATDHRGRRVFGIELAAECPEGLCDQLAAEFAKSCVEEEEPPAQAKDRRVGK